MPDAGTQFRIYSKSDTGTRKLPITAPQIALDYADVDFVIEFGRIRFGFGKIALISW